MDSAAAEGCYADRERAEGGCTLASCRRSCSPEGSDCRQDPSNVVASEVTVRATQDEPSVSSLICSGLQTINEQLPVAEPAWVAESYDVGPQQCSGGGAELTCSDDRGEICDHVVLQHEEAASEIDPYPAPPVPVDPLACVYVSAAQNSNNSNSCAIAPTVDDGMRGVDTGPRGINEPPKKRAKYTKTNSAIEITLEGKNLWEEFCRRGTEMIVNRSGRRMFPGFSVGVSGLKPKVKYTMKLEVVLADNHRFKFLNARWLAVGTAEPQPLSETYIHPDSPNSGAFWMRHGISFRKLKITNNKERPGNNALLHSMHKYFLRLVMEEERKTPPGEDKLPAKPVLQMDFPETTFIAVTAYQNEEVTQLKITNNPFAKAFRDNAADMDWDTAQMLYTQHQGYSPLFQQYSEHFGNHMPAPGSWPLPSPLLPTTPLTASLPPISPFTVPGNRGYITPSGHYPYTSSAGCISGAPGAGHVPQPLSASAPGYFQWPTATRHTPQQAHVIPSSSHDIYEHYPSSGYICPSGPPSQPHANPPSNLPDFDTVFTSSLGPHTSHS